MSNLRGVGREAEDQAADYLLAQGYTLVTRRFKGRRGEIDIVALDGEVMVFVEVKLRRSKEYIAEESIGRRKTELMVEAAGEFLLQHAQPEHPARYDVIAIDRTGLRHHIDAFRPVDGERTTTVLAVESEEF